MINLTEPTITESSEIVGNQRQTQNTISELVWVEGPSAVGQGDNFGPARAINWKAWSRDGRGRRSITGDCPMRDILTN